MEGIFSSSFCLAALTVRGDPHFTLDGALTCLLLTTIASPAIFASAGFHWLSAEEASNEPSGLPSRDFNPS